MVPLTWLSNSRCCIVIALSVLQADYRQDGTQLLICGSVDGEVRGFTTAGGDTQQSLLDVNVDQDTLRELSQKKQVCTPACMAICCSVISALVIFAVLR